MMGKRNLRTSRSVYRLSKLLPTAHDHANTPTMGKKPSTRRRRRWRLNRKCFPSRKGYRLVTLVTQHVTFGLEASPFHKWLAKMTYILRKWLLLDTRHKTWRRCSKLCCCVDARAVSSLGSIATQLQVQLSSLPRIHRTRPTNAS